MTEIRYPKITGATDKEQLFQIKSYLFQLSQDLTMALGQIDAKQQDLVSNSATGISKGSSQEADAQASFNDIKGLIIKSADIVEAYYETINKRLEGLYVAQSEFGTYKEQTAQDILANSTSIQQMFENIQTITSSVTGINNYLIGVNAHIKSGLLYYDDEGIPIYGLEIGQRTEIDGKEVFDKFARFTSEKLSFYDQNGAEVAYVSDRQLYITKVHVTGSFRVGAFVENVIAGGETVVKWVGGDS